jgi:hypothetical protein
VADTSESKLEELKRIVAQDITEITALERRMRDLLAHLVLHQKMLEEQRALVRAQRLERNAPLADQPRAVA